MGQSTVEYVLVISVIVIALVVSLRYLGDGLREGLRDMNSDVRTITEQGYVGGSS